MAISVEKTFIKVDLSNGVSKYYYKNDALDMKEFENFYGKIPTHDLVPPPPPPIPNLINTNPERFAKELGFDGKMPLFVINDRVLQQEKINIKSEDIKLIQVKKSDSDIQDVVRKFGKQAENGAILIYTKSFKGCILEEPVNEVFKVVEQMPRFPGCENEVSEHEKKDCSNRKMLDYIYSHLKYPAEAKDKSIEGNVVAQFTINKDGSISDINIIREIGGGCGQAVIEMLQSMNDMPEKWVPGKQAGRNVNVLYTLPVKFKMTDDQPRTEVVEELPEKSDEAIKKDTYKIVGAMALFPISEKIDDAMQRMSVSGREMIKFIQKHLKYPSKAKENNIEGVVYIRMTLDAKGKVTEAILKEDIGYGCGEEALRVVKMMPNWIPATIDGKAVESSQIIPIAFKLKSNGNTETRVINSIDPQNLNIFPNPTSDFIELSLTGSKEDVEVTIMDLSGKLLFKQKFDNNSEHFKTKIDISQINVPTILVKTVQGNKAATNQVVIRK
nr:TonB family protein [Saprospiraceae bacterium]